MTKEQTPKRTYDSPLRRQQQEMTTEAIMAAVEELILEGSIHNFTIQKVAKLAGVSYASIYRHFPSREALVQGYRDWCMENVSPVPPPYVDSLDDLPAWVERTIPLFSNYWTRVKALFAAMSALQINHVHPQSRDRDEWIARLVNDAAPDAPDDIRRASNTIIRMMVSITTWVDLHHRYGLDETEMNTTVAGVIRAQILYLNTFNRREKHDKQ